MDATMTVRTDMNTEIIYEVKRMVPVLGNPVNLVALLINKYCDSDKNWIICDLRVVDGIIGYTLYPINQEIKTYKTIGEVLNSATSDDIADITIMPRVKITQKLREAEAITI